MGYWSHKRKAGRPFPRSAIVVAGGSLAAMTYAILLDGRARTAQRKQKQEEERAAAAESMSGSSSSDGDTGNVTKPLVWGSGATASSSTAKLLSDNLASAPGTSSFTSPASAAGPSAANVPSYVLATSGLDNEQKLQVALCRRQAWLRAAQAAPTLALWSYAACVLAESSGLAKLPRGTHFGVTIGAAVIGATAGAYYGGLEGKPMMNQALLSRQVEHAHTRRDARPKEEDAFLTFVRDASQGTATQSERERRGKNSGVPA